MSQRIHHILGVNFRTEELKTNKEFLHCMYLLSLISEFVYDNRCSYHFYSFKKFVDSDYFTHIAMYRLGYLTNLECITYHNAGTIFKLHLGLRFPQDMELFETKYNYMQRIILNLDKIGIHTNVSHLCLRSKIID